MFVSYSNIVLMALASLPSVGKVIPRICFEIVRDFQFVEEGKNLRCAVSYATHYGMFRVAFIVAQ